MARATLKEVAARAGVSHQTVSNVLNGVSVRPETRDRVRVAMRELNYQPNFAAKALRAAKSMTVTLAFFEHDSEEIGDPYRNLIQSAVMYEATKLGYSLLSTSIHRTGPATLVTLQETYLQRRTDGAILVGVPNDATLLQQIRNAKLPVVLYDYAGPPAGFPTIVAQYAEGIRQVVDHLTGLGKQHLALVIPPDDITTRVEREYSFLAATQGRGLETTIYRGDWTYASGERAFHHLWTRDRKPDAILAGNDRMAVGLLAAARRLGVRVPQDVTVTGFDDFEFSRYTVPSLTTVHVPYAHMAREALRQLLQSLSGTSAEPDMQRFPVHFIRRESA